MPNSNTSHEEQGNLVAVMVRFQPSVHEALKAESRATAVPVSIIVRQVIGGWLNSRGSASTAR